MAETKDPNDYTVVFTDKFDGIAKLFKKRRPDIFERLYKQIVKLSRNPKFGKPLKNVMRNQRRIHVGSFVLIYEINQGKVRLLDFDHHDKIYKKYKV